VERTLQQLENENRAARLTGSNPANSMILLAALGGCRISVAALSRVEFDRCVALSGDGE